MRDANFEPEDEAAVASHFLFCRRLYLLPLSGAIFVLLAIILCSVAIEKFEYQVEIQKQRIATEKRVNDVATILSSAMNVRLNLTSSLKAFVATHRQFSTTDFNHFASVLKGDLLGISSLQLAPNGIVKYVTDLSRNRQAVGHNLLVDPKRKVAAEQSIMEHSYIIAGPLDLIQGGRAVIARRPIYFSNAEQKEEKFWGFAIILIDIDTLLKSTLMSSLQEDFNVAIRGTDGLGAAGDVFYGKASVFESPLAVANISLPNASWQLSVQAKSQRIQSGFIGSSLYWFTNILLAIIGAVIIYSMLDRPRKLKSIIESATAKLRFEITQRQEAESKIRFLALHDELTSLPNRRLFDELGKQALSVAKRENMPFAVLFIDVDGFKTINDTLGHAFGDGILKMFGQRLKQQVREPDIVARFGGDEFVILLSDNCHLIGAEKVTKKIISAIAKPFRLSGETVSIGASVGIAVYPDHGISIEQLLKKADLAMYSEKMKKKTDEQVMI